MFKVVTVVVIYGFPAVIVIIVFTMVLIIKVVLTVRMTATIVIYIDQVLLNEASSGSMLRWIVDRYESLDAENNCSYFLVLSSSFAA